MTSEMTRAEEAALRAYPRAPFGPQNITDDDRNRQAYIKGYEQAEKDLVLTWKDIREISRILDMIVDDDIKGKIPEEWGDEEYYEEVLRRFNKAKEETK